MRIPEIVRNASTPTRPSAYLEGLLLVVAATAWDLSLGPASAGFHGWPLDPYLLIVLLLASRYGSAPGLAGAVLCELGRTVSLAVAAGGWAGLALIGPSRWSHALLSVIVAVIAGAFTDRFKRFLRTAASSHDDVTVRFDRLSVEYTLLADEKLLLDKQVLGNEQTFEALVSLFDHLERLPARRMPRLILEIASRIVGGGRPALFRVRRGSRGPTLAAGGAGAPQPQTPAPGAAVLLASLDPGWDRALPLDQPLLARACRTSKVITIVDVDGWQNLTALSREPLHLACRLKARWGRARLLLVMRDLPFASYSPSRLRALGVAMQVASRALCRGQLLRRLRFGTRDGALSRISNVAYFNSRMEEELTLGEAKAIPVGVLKVKVPPCGPDAPRARRDRLLRTVSSVLMEAVRKGDLVAHASRAGSFSVLVPIGSHKPVDDVAAFLRREVAARMEPDQPPAAGELAITTLRFDPAPSGPVPSGVTGRQAPQGAETGRP